MKSKKLVILILGTVLIMNLFACAEKETSNIDSIDKEYITKETADSKKYITKETASVKTEEIEIKENSSRNNKIMDGVSDEYVMMPIQAPVDQIINEYHEKGYQYVYLTSHMVKKGRKK